MFIARQWWKTKVTQLNLVPSTDNNVTIYLTPIMTSTQVASITDRLQASQDHSHPDYQTTQSHFIYV